MLAESLNDALVECVKAAGGSKVVGPAIWPAKGMEAAQRHLLSCLNPDRNEKLGPDEVLMVLRMARESGFHAGAAFVLRDLGYADPVPIEPEDERATLQRQFIESTRALSKLADRIEKLDRPVLRSAA